MNFISCKFAKIISIFLMMIVVIVSLICPFNAAMVDEHVSGVTDLSATLQPTSYVLRGCPSGYVCEYRAISVCGAHLLSDVRTI